MSNKAMQRPHSIIVIDQEDEYKPTILPEIFHFMQRSRLAEIPATLLKNMKVSSNILLIKHGFMLYIA